MAGRINVGRPRRIKHIPLSWDVNKARSNHQPKFRPVGDDILRGREKTVGQLMEEMFEQMPPATLWVSGELNPQEYLNEALQVAEPFRVQIAEILQQTFNDGSLMQEDRIRADINNQLKRLGSPLRLTNSKGEVTKASTDVYQVGGFKIGKSPKYEWSPIGIEAFDEVSAVSTRYAQTRSAELVTNIMIPEQQKVIQQLIGESFTAQQTFSTGRTVTGLTAQQTSQALVNVLQEVNPTTSVGQNLANFRGVNANGLTRPWEKAVYHRAERMADSLASKGVTGVKAQMRIQRDAQRYADKLRRSRARMISRTEIKRAQVEGQLASMREALDQGLADPATAGKKWITGATDVCSVCSDLGFSRAIPLDQSFEGVGDGPPAHPNCRCDLDFSHKIKEAPRAVGAGDPNFPAGTEQNPIVWQFNSGFQTQPSATRAFTPTGFIPPPTIPPPPTSTPVIEPPPPTPSAPKPPVEAPVKPTEVKPASPADIVWDDAGRKWADLTNEERLFLYETDIDLQLQKHISDLVDEPLNLLGINKGGANLDNLPPLPADASDGVKAIRKQQEKVINLAEEKNKQIAVTKIKKSLLDDQEATLKKVNRSRYEYGPDVDEGITIGERKILIGDETFRQGYDADEELEFLMELLKDPNRAATEIQTSKFQTLYDKNTRTYYAQNNIPPARGIDIGTPATKINVTDLDDEVNKLGKLISEEAKRVNASRVEIPEDNWLTRISGVTDAEDGAFTNLRATNEELIEEVGDRLVSDLPRQTENWSDDLIRELKKIEEFSDSYQAGVTIRVSNNKNLSNDLIGGVKGDYNKTTVEKATEVLSERGLNVAMESAGERFLREEVARLLKGSSDDVIETAAEQVAIRFRQQRLQPVRRHSPSKAVSQSSHLNDIGDDISQIWKEVAEEYIEQGLISKADVLDDLIPMSRQSQGGIAMPKADGTIEQVFSGGTKEALERLEKTVGVRAARSINKQLPEILEDAERYVDDVIAKLRLVDRKALDELDSESLSAWVRYLEEVTGETYQQGEAVEWAMGLFYRPDALKSVDDIPVNEIKKALKRIVGKADPDEAGYANSLLSDVISSDIQRYLGADVEVFLTQLEGYGFAGTNRSAHLLGKLAEDLKFFATSNTDEVLASTFMEVLHTVRTFGDEAVDWGTDFTIYNRKALGTKMNPALEKQFETLNEVISKWVPDDWVIQSNARGQVGIYRRGKRAHYTDHPNGNGLINIESGGIGNSTSLHEINHRFQQNNDLHRLLENKMVDNRIASSPIDKQGISKYAKGEYGFEDEFPTLYVGKYYKTESDLIPEGLKFLKEDMNMWETSAMASEYVSAGRKMTDGRIIDWFLGMLAGI